MGVPVLYAGSKYYPGIPPDKQYPVFSSAEVGNVNASTVAVTFSVNVSASNYATGVTIKVNGSGATISSATRQANHAVVYYVLSAAVVNGDTVTWEYSGGNIINEATGAVLQTMSAQSVTNNVAAGGPPIPLLDLEADTLVLSDGDSVGTWADQSGNGRDFTQSGTARPTKQTVSTYPAVVFDGVDDWMLGPVFADNLDSMTLISVVESWNGILASKIGNDFCSDPGSTGWSLWDTSLTLLTDTSNNIGQGTTTISSTKHLYIHDVVSRAELHSYLDGVLDDRFPGGGDVSGSGVSSYANSEPVRLCADGLGPGGCDSATSGKLYAFRIYSPALSPTDRATITTALAARYGITLP